MARDDVEFTARGVILLGWLYPAEGATGEAPCAVLWHGFEHLLTEGN